MPLDKVLNKIEDFKCCHPHIVDEKVEDYLHENKLLLKPTREVYDNYHVLTMEQIEKMANSDKSLITFGSHTHQHELLTLMTKREVKETLEESHNRLKDIPNYVPVFCYPNGYHEEEHLQICGDAGYKFAVLATGGFWKKKHFDFEIPRRGVGRGYSMGKFTSIVSGSLDFLQLLTGRRRK
jgi:peptidoglycan/xylan/chitin deacetylase (PgdA/CDA1 family)